MTEQTQHLDDGTLQSYIEDELPEGRRDVIRSHVAICEPCARRLEAWEVLMVELDQLPAFDPAAAFQDRVLTALAVRPEPAQGLWERVRSALRHGAAGRHLSAAAIQDYLDGTVAARSKARLRAHVSSCSSCRDRVRDWKRVFGVLEGMGRIEPPNDLALRVMGRIDPGRSRSIAPQSGGSRAPRLLAAARSLLPQSGLGWTVAGSVAAAPVVGLVTIIVAIIVHPLITFGDLFAFASWRISDLVQLAGTWTLGWAVEGSMALVQSGPLQALVSSPGWLALTLSSLWATVLCAGWILYRYVVAPTLSTRRHVKAS